MFLRQSPLLFFFFYTYYFIYFFISLYVSYSCLSLHSFYFHFSTNLPSLYINFISCGFFPFRLLFVSLYIAVITLFPFLFVIFYLYFLFSHYRSPSLFIVFPSSAHSSLLLSLSLFSYVYLLSLFTSCLFICVLLFILCTTVSLFVFTIYVFLHPFYHCSPL